MLLLLGLLPALAYAKSELYDPIYKPAQIA